MRLYECRQPAEVCEGFSFTQVTPGEDQHLIFLSQFSSHIYVITEAGEVRVLIEPELTPKFVSHAWMAEGKPVLAAGSLRINNGQITEITNYSGHYMPSRDSLPIAREIFRSVGLPLAEHVELQYV